MHFYKVSSNYSGVRMKRERDSSNTKGLVVCGQDQTTVDRIRLLWTIGRKEMLFKETGSNHCGREGSKGI